MFCTNCGTKITSHNLQFCTDCGKPIKNNRFKFYGNQKNFAIIGVVVFVLFVFIFTYFYNQSHSPQAIVKKYLQAVESKDAKEVATLLDKQDYINEATVTSFISWLERNPNEEKRMRQELAEIANSGSNIAPVNFEKHYGFVKKGFAIWDNYKVYIKPANLEISVNNGIKVKLLSLDKEYKDSDQDVIKSELVLPGAYVYTVEAKDMKTSEKSFGKGAVETSPGQLTKIDVRTILAAPVRLGSQKYYIDKNGKTLTVESPNFFYRNITGYYKNDKFYAEGLTPFRLENLCGYVDDNGKLVIPLQYEEALQFSQGNAIVRKNGRWGYIDKTGQLKSPQFEILNDTTEGVGIAKSNGKFGLIDSYGKSIVPYQFDVMYLTNSGDILVGLNGKYGMIDKTGKYIIQPQFEDLFFYREEVASVKLNGKHGFIDKQGNFLVQPQYDYNLYFSEGLAAVRVNGKSGYIDKTGRIAIPLQYGLVAPFNEGLASVRTNDGIKNNCGFIDKEGKLVIPPQFYMASSFFNGLAAVSISNSLVKYGYIDNSGKMVIPPQYDWAGSFDWYEPRILEKPPA
ncbi:WG repeat-containing protein [Sporomusa aerivorans]|uniref:WG repeat-containing protein n=1 Tax=Sporomusa aerivorans TaxID=204936 RepID=UPI00352AE245